MMMGVEPPVAIPKDSGAAIRDYEGYIHEKTVLVVESKSVTRNLLDYLRLIRPEVGQCERHEALRLVAAIHSQVHVQIGATAVGMVELKRTNDELASGWPLSKVHSKEAFGDVDRL